MNQLHTEELMESPRPANLVPLHDAPQYSGQTRSPSTGSAREAHDMIVPAGIAIFSFGPFTLRPAARRLERYGVKVVLGDRALDILVALVERAGSVIAKRDLISLVWRNVVVEEGSLRVRLVELRRALEDLRGDESYIANVKGQGYCFVGNVSRFGISRSVVSKNGSEERPSRALTLMSSPLGAESALECISNSESDEVSPQLEPDRVSAGTIEIELPAGFKLRVTGDVDEANLRQVILALSRLVTQ
jgi:DNA-binding winged helix-turn-helix (wHTH) protein